MLQWLLGDSNEALQRVGREGTGNESIGGLNGLAVVEANRIHDDWPRE